VPCKTTTRTTGTSYAAEFDDSLVAGVRKGDVLTRKLDGAVYEVVRVVPNGFGGTTLQLSKRKRTTH
jgi:hypothetical protein